MKKLTKHLSLIVVSLFAINCFSQVVPLNSDDEEVPQKKVSKFEFKRAAQALWYYQKVEQYAQTTKYVKRLQERLNKNQIVGLELVIAAPTESAIESRWGHSMMRFVDNVGTASDDIMFGFVAEVDDLKINYVKGVLGSYPTYPALQSLRLFNQQYIKDQDRPLERIIVPSNDSIRKQIIEKLVQEWNEIELKNTDNYQREITQSLEKIRRVKLKKFEKATVETLKTESGAIFAFALTEGEEVLYTEPVYFRLATADDLGGYTFLSGNCAGALIHFLQNLKLISTTSLKWNGRVPIGLPQYFAKNGLSYLPKVVIPGIYELKLKILKILGLPVEDLYNFEKWPKTASAEFVGTLSIKEKLILLDTYSLFPDEVIDDIKKSLPAKNQRPSYEEIYGIVDIDAIAYTTCQDATCAANQLRTLKAETKNLASTMKAVILNPKKLSTENYDLLTQHYNSFKQLLREQGENL